MTSALPIATTIPIACTLGADDYAERLGWITALNRSSLRAHRRDGLALELDYAPDAAAQVRELVAREQACCAFLAFHLHDTLHGVHLTVTAPTEAGEALDAVFSPFLVGVDQ